MALIETVRRLLPVGIRMPGFSLLQVSPASGWLARMKSIRTMLWVGTLGLAIGLQELGAILPTMNEAPWTGFFAGYENRSFHLAIGPDGSVKLSPLNQDGNLPDQFLVITGRFEVEEVKPDGSLAWHEIDPESWTSEQAAALNPKPFKMAGKTKDGMDVVLDVSLERGVLKLGGKVTPAAASANPLRLAFRLDMPNVYPSGAGDDEKAFYKRIRRDSVSVDRLEGGREKFKGDEQQDAAKKVTGKGLRAATFEFDAYQGKRIHFEVEGQAMLQLENGGEKPLNNGMAVRFRPDPAKDPEGKSRLLIGVR